MSTVMQTAEIPTADKRIPCRRCLLEQMPDRQEYYQSVQHLRSVMPAAERTPDGVYTIRLAYCKECDQLQDATCMQCGCYVEVRAARKDMHCPMDGRW